MPIRRLAKRCRRGFNATVKETQKFFSPKVDYKHQAFLNLEKIGWSIWHAALIATKNGLYVLTHSEMARLLEGSFYGISYYEGEWFTYQSFSKSGRIISFNFMDGWVLNPRVRIPNVDYGCHQIDWFVPSWGMDERLYVMNTYENGVFEYRPHPFSPCRYRLSVDQYPFGFLSDGRSSDNYRHMNSIRIMDGMIFIVCHNESQKTGRNSCIEVLDGSFNHMKTIELQSQCAHNIMPYMGDLKQGILHCDSLNGKLKLGGETVFSCDLFTRGLAMSDKFILVGGSAYGDRESRDQSQGKVYVLSKNFDHLATIDVPGMVQEIRLVGCVDYGRSMSDAQIKDLPKVSSSPCCRAHSS